jgi:hypothetical protein
MAMEHFLSVLGLEVLEWGTLRSLTTRKTRENNPFIGQILDTAFEEAQAILILITPDDEARLKETFHSETDKLKPHEITLTGQARPNVIFEAGLAMGRHPERTILVQVGDVRPFSDIDGRHVPRIDDSPNTRIDLASRLKDAGCIFDIEGKTAYLNAGRFVPATKTTREFVNPSATALPPVKRQNSKNLVTAYGVKWRINGLSVEPSALCPQCETNLAKHSDPDLSALSCSQCGFNAGFSPHTSDEVARRVAAGDLG